jgi:hypothetical protein
MQIKIALSLFSLAMAYPAMGQSSRPRTTKVSIKRIPFPEAWKKGANMITPEACHEWLSVLASDEFEGRGTGKAGFKKAAEYMAKQFKEFGLKPMGENGGYFQTVPFEGSQVNAEETWIALENPKGKGVITLSLGKGLGGSIQAESNKTYPFVLVVAKSPKDLEGLELKGKALLLLDRSKPWRFGITQVGRSLWGLRPDALVRIDDKAAAQDPSKQMSVRFSGKGSKGTRGRTRRRRPNRYAIDKKSAAQILTASGLDPELLEGEKTGAFHSKGFVLHTHVKTTKKPAFAVNVVGFLEGSDPVLKKEVVGIGAHLDHLGKAPNGQVYNGADDDGSGSTGLLAVAKAFGKNGLRPKRSLLFMAFCGEEMGLIGSAWYAENPVLPNKTMVAELQMDMIGRNEENARKGEKAEDNENSLHLIGSKKLSEELHKICLEANERFTGFDFEWDEENVFFRSDHVNFAKKDIPIAFFFTGFHPQYHRTSDTIDRINFPKLARVARLVYGIAWTIAEMDHRPKLDRSYKEVMKGQRRGRGRR